MTIEAAGDRLFEIDSLLGLTVVSALDAEYRRSEVASQLRKQLFEFADQNQPHRVIVNLEAIHLQMVFSTFLGAILNFSRHIQPDGGQAALCNLTDALRESMAIVDPQQRMFRVFDTLGQAWDWLRSLDAALMSQREHMTDDADSPLFESGKIRGVFVLTLQDAEYIRQEVCDALRRQLGELITEHRPTRVIVNFEQIRVPNLYSRFAGVVMNFQSKCLKPIGGNTALCNMPAIVRETFRVYDPDQKLLRLCDTLGQAYDWLRSLDG